jgi:hypothetical protein
VAVDVDTWFRCVVRDCGIVHGEVRTNPRFVDRRNCGENAGSSEKLWFERYDVTNRWLFAFEDVVTGPYASEALPTEG